MTYQALQLRVIHLGRLLAALALVVLLPPVATGVELGVGAGLTGDHPTWETGQLRVFTHEGRIFIVVDRSVGGIAADGIADAVIAFDTREEVAPLSAEGFGIVQRQAERLLVTLPGTGLTLDLALADWAEAERTAATDAHPEVIRYHRGRAISTWSPAADEALSPGDAVSLVLQQATPISPVPILTLGAPILHKDPEPGGDDTCAKSCAKGSHTGASCNVTCNLGECAKCKLVPLECKCVPAE